MRKLYDHLILVVQVFTGALSLLMLSVVVLGVFYRYVIDNALVWYDEFAGYLLVWLTMYGSVVALAKRKHIGFETLVEKLPAGARRVAEIFALVCVLGFAIILAVTGMQLIGEMGAETAVSLPWVRMSWIYSVMPISGALMAVTVIKQAVDLAGEKRRGGGAAGRGSVDDAPSARRVEGAR
jgi:TRAP-type C4-dicarboxylate transport system permease small subunit